MIIIKTEKEFEKIKDAGTRLGELFDYLIPYIKPGISTYEIDKLAENISALPEQSQLASDMKDFHSQSVLQSMNALFMVSLLKIKF